MVDCWGHVGARSRGANAAQTSMRRTTSLEPGDKLPICLFLGSNPRCSVRCEDYIPQREGACSRCSRKRRVRRVVVVDWSTLLAALLGVAGVVVGSYLTARLARAETYADWRRSRLYDLYVQLVPVLRRIQGASSPGSGAGDRDNKSGRPATRTHAPCGSLVLERCPIRSQSNLQLAEQSRTTVVGSWGGTPGIQSTADAGKSVGDQAADRRSAGYYTT